jgi:hypothetical protein
LIKKLSRGSSRLPINPPEVLELNGSVSLNHFPLKAPGHGRNETEIDRLYNDAAIAIKVLHEAAEAGSGAAREALRDLTVKLIIAAGRYGSPPANAD